MSRASSAFADMRFVTRRLVRGWCARQPPRLLCLAGLALGLALPLARAGAQDVPPDTVRDSVRDSLPAPALARGMLITVRFGAPRPLPLLDAQGAPARRTGFAAGVPPLMAVAVLGRITAHRGDTLVISPSQVDTAGGGEPVRLRRGLHARVLRDEATTVTPFDMRGARFVRNTVIALGVTVVLVSALWFNIEAYGSWGR